MKNQNAHGINDHEASKVKRMPSPLSAFILSNSRRITICFKTDTVLYMDTDSIEFEKNFWDKLNKAVHDAEMSGQRKHEYASGDILYVLF